MPAGTIPAPDPAPRSGRASAAARSCMRRRDAAAPACESARQGRDRSCPLVIPHDVSTGRGADLFPKKARNKNGDRPVILASPHLGARGDNMTAHTDRRDFLKLSGMAGVAFASGLFPAARAQTAPEFHFVQFSDTHWGFKGAPNPDAEHTLEKAVATVNALASPPDFIVFTGDLTHTTDDGKVRRERMKRFKEIVSALTVKDGRFMPGEHDASLDKGQAYK